MAAVWKTLKISKGRRLSKKSRKMRRRRKQRGGADVPTGLGGTVTGAMKNSGSDYSSPDDMFATRSLPQSDEAV